MNQKSEFDNIAEKYSELVEDGMILKGNDHEYFNQYKLFYLRPYFALYNGRAKVLDYGCGVGLLSQTIQDCFPKTVIHGFDVSSESIENVSDELRKRQNNLFTAEIGALHYDYDIAILSTVLHHVSLEERQQVIDNIYARLSIGGKLVIFEHNMLNPLTRKSVDACPFDKDAVMISLSQAKALLKHAGFENISSRYITFFPEQLRRLWGIDKYISWLPLGAQYMVVATK